MLDYWRDKNCLELQINWSLVCHSNEYLIEESPYESNPQYATTTNSQQISADNRNSSIFYLRWQLQTDTTSDVYYTPQSKMASKEWLRKDEDA